MALSLDTTLRNNRLDQIASRVGANGLLRVYSGTAPANVGAALSGNTQLGELACGATFAPAASGGVLTPTTPTQDNSADASGTATFFRVYQSNGTTPVIQGTVGTSGQDMNLNTTTIAAGGPISITSFTINENNA